MKKIIKQLFEALGMLWSYLCPRNLTKMCKGMRDSFYTGYLRRRFAHLGSSVFEWKALHLAGERFMTIGNGNIFEPGLQLTVRQTGSTLPTLTIGNGCLFRHGCHITAANSITIGDNLLTGTNVIITDNSHGTTDTAILQQPPRQRSIVSKGPVVIGNNVWLGNNVCVLPGVTIGDGAVVGANSVVTHDLPAYSIAVGIPAKNVRQIDIEKTSE